MTDKVYDDGPGKPVDFYKAVAAESLGGRVRVKFVNLAFSFCSMRYDAPRRTEIWNYRGPYVHVSLEDKAAGFSPRVFYCTGNGVFDTATAEIVGLRDDPVSVKFAQQVVKHIVAQSQSFVDAGYPTTFPFLFANTLRAPLRGEPVREEISFSREVFHGQKDTPSL